MTPWDNLTYHDFIWAIALARDFEDALAWQTPAYIHEED